MSKLFFYSICLLIPAWVGAQATGIRFSDDLSWTQIVAKASAENKYIFMDCFTTWCGPCRAMRDGIFPRKEVGDSYNGKFICVSVQMDTTKKDNDTVKNWYADAHRIMTRFGI